MQWPNEWPRARSGVPPQGALRTQLTDFRVTEELGFTADGEGEHCLLYIEKRNLNTADVAQRVARLAVIPLSAIGFCGMKDRQAVTRQYFSAGLAGGPEPDWQELNCEQLIVLNVARHRRKLRRGVHSRNRFELVLRELGPTRSELESRCLQIARQGVPNYFGDQRFGRRGANLHKAQKWMAEGRAPRGRTQRSMVLSSARSWLFNECLGSRVRAQSWLLPSVGDICVLAGSRSYFSAGLADTNLQQRHDERDLHLGVPLWGVGESPWQNDPVLSQHGNLANWLQSQGLKMDYRAARLVPDDFSWQFCDDGALRLKFALPSGGFATAIARELITTNDNSFT